MGTATRWRTRKTSSPPVFSPGTHAWCAYIWVYKRLSWQMLSGWFFFFLVCSSFLGAYMWVNNNKPLNVLKQRWQRRQQQGLETQHELLVSLCIDYYCHGCAAWRRRGGFCFGLWFWSPTCFSSPHRCFYCLGYYFPCIFVLCTVVLPLN